MKPNKIYHEFKSIWRRLSVWKKKMFYSQCQLFFLTFTRNVTYPKDQKREKIADMKVNFIVSATVLQLKCHQYILKQQLFYVYDVLLCIFLISHTKFIYVEFKGKKFTYFASQSGIFWTKKGIIEAGLKLDLLFDGEMSRRPP